MGAIDAKRGEFVGMIGGLSFLPYALLKTHVTGEIIATETAIPGASPELTAQLFHVAEAVPIVMIAVGFHALERRTSGTRTARPSTG